MIDHFSASPMPVVNSEQNGVSVLAQAVALRGIHTSAIAIHAAGSQPWRARVCGCI